MTHGNGVEPRSFWIAAGARQCLGVHAFGRGDHESDEFAIGVDYDEDRPAAPGQDGGMRDVKRVKMCNPVGEFVGGINREHQDVAFAQRMSGYRRPPQFEWNGDTRNLEDDGISRPVAVDMIERWHVHGIENPLVPAEMGFEIGDRDFEVVYSGKWRCGHTGYPR